MQPSWCWGGTPRGAAGGRWVGPDHSATVGTSGRPVSLQRRRTVPVWVRSGRGSRVGRAGPARPERKGGRRPARGRAGLGPKGQL